MLKQGPRVPEVLLGLALLSCWLGTCHSPQLLGHITWRLCKVSGLYS